MRSPIRPSTIITYRIIRPVAISIIRIIERIVITIVAIRRVSPAQANTYTPATAIPIRIGIKWIIITAAPVRSVKPTYAGRIIVIVFQIIIIYNGSTIVVILFGRHFSFRRTLYLHRCFVWWSLIQSLLW